MPDITIACPDGAFSAYLASPTGNSGGGVLVIQEIFGVNKDMRDHCDHLAAQGYFALCPDIFWRQEPGIQITDQSEEEWAKAFELYQGFDVDKGVADLKVALAHLRTVEGCTGKAGTVGFCLGGLLAYLMAAESDAECNVSYYGVGIDERLAAADGITAPTLLHIAEEDGFVPKEAQAKIKDGLGGHPSISLHSYPGVDHAFARHAGVNYDAAAATLADSRTMECFNANLG
ncbi:MAG: dienelactone hydrolase family protein [Alphaproteobacteria bacterium]|nr:dienelactone hydrolase family protein [Alphaproteobacteria bacterium]